MKIDPSESAGSQFRVRLLLSLVIAIAIVIVIISQWSSSYSNAHILFRGRKGRDSLKHQFSVGRPIAHIFSYKLG